MPHPPSYMIIILLSSQYYGERTRTCIIVWCYYIIIFFCHCRRYGRDGDTVCTVYRIPYKAGPEIFARFYFRHPAIARTTATHNPPIPPTHGKRVLDLNVVNINGHRNSTLRNGCRGVSGDHMRACVRQRLAGYMLFLLRYYIILCVLSCTRTHTCIIILRGPRCEYYIHVYYMYYYDNVRGAAAVCM